MFVLLHHTGWKGRRDHYDLMLQFEDVPAGDEDSRVLAAFATDRDGIPIPPPSETPETARKKVVLMRIENHRAVYLRFEGEIPGGRGQVRIVDRGGISWLSHPIAGDSMCAAGVERRSGASFRLDGILLRGKFSLVPIGNGLYEFERSLEKG